MAELFPFHIVFPTFRSKSRWKSELLLDEVKKIAQERMEGCRTPESYVNERLDHLSVVAWYLLLTLPGLPYAKISPS